MEGKYQFRNDWVAPYFWMENYCKAYQDVVVAAPHANNDIYVDVLEGRIVKPPPQPPQKKGRRKRKRGLGCAATRSRAKFDVKGYQKRKRSKAGRTGPANPFVNRTDPNIFKKSSRGRKPLSHQERMSGVQEASQMLKEAIVQEKSNPSTRKKKKEEEEKI